MSARREVVLSMAQASFRQLQPCAQHDCRPARRRLGLEAWMPGVEEELRSGVHQNEVLEVVGRPSNPFRDFRRDHAALVKQPGRIALKQRYACRLCGGRGLAYQSDAASD
jgi:hypothetical protein